MNSLDTNILLYAANQDTPEHPKALAVVNRMLATPTEWVIADQVLFELYKALRNPRILDKPRAAKEAAGIVGFLRNESRVSHCAYEAAIFAAVLDRLGRHDFPPGRTHDAVLAATLRARGVDVFYTRNKKDFADAGFQRVINPIDE